MSATASDYVHGYVISCQDGGYDVHILGTGAMKDYSSSPFRVDGYTLKNAYISDGVTSIGNSAFNCCDSLTSITIPDSVTSIGSEAFRWCTSLTSITIPDGVTSIGDDAFSWCTSLTSITIPDSVTSIGEWAFKYCNSLTSIYIPDGVTSIGDDAFSSTAYYNDTNNWQNKVLYIGNCLIKAKTTIDECAIKEGTTCIANYAFDGCSSLTSITIPDSVMSIGDSAFYNCSSLTSITIPDGVTSIGKWAFSGCRQRPGNVVQEVYVLAIRVIDDQQLVSYQSGKLSYGT
ncbi:MAG: leucine-rich repeat protein, partial [Clostridia bacterium]|nr:leucine-rich repeat protein [Clostridia bacterium]